jgi:hypothetical protein
MKTEKELENAILDMLNKMQNDFPELTKYINEIPLLISGSKSQLVTTSELEAFFNSLHEIYSQYSHSHSVSKVG